jgi:hypothetical protein
MWFGTTSFSITFGCGVAAKETGRLIGEPDQFPIAWF